MKIIRGLVLLFLLSNPAFAAKFELSVHHWTTGSGLPDNRVLSITQDSVGYICIKTESGNYRFDGSESRLDPLCREYEKKDSVGNIFLRNNIININGVPVGGRFNKLIECSDGTHWASSSRGIGIVNIQDETFNRIGDLQDMPVPECNHLVEGSDGKIWFSMSLNGIGFWDKELEKIFTLKNINDFIHFRNGHEVFSELMDRDITTLYFDRIDNLWIGTQNAGLYKITFKPERFQFFRYGYDKQTGLAHKDISFPLVTKSGDVWISTWGGGINVWKKEDLELSDPEFESIPVLLKNGKPIPEKRIFPLLEDSRSNIWFGTFGGGLYHLKKTDRDKKNYSYKEFNRKNKLILSDTIGALCEGLNQDLWCGTYNGITHINQDLETRSSFPELANPNVFLGQEVSLIRMGASQNLWIGTRGGTTFRWNLKTNEVHEYRKSKGQSMGIIFNYARINKVEWFVGSTGVYYYDKPTNEFLPYTNNENLPIGAIQSLLVDDRGKLWVGTNSGLAKIDPLTNDFFQIDLPGGIMRSSFTQGASKDKNGYLYFGSRYGFYRFHPDNMEYEEPLAPIIVKRISINGKSFFPDLIYQSKMWQNENQSNTGFLNLKHNQNNISFEYNSLNYSSTPVGYEIMLEGNDNKWEETTDVRRAWNSLNSGDYIFKVRRTGSFDTISIPIKIAPVWWSTWQAIVSFFVFVFLMMGLISRQVLIRTKAKEKARQKEKYDLLRFRFFLNISHEIRTPLTLIKGAIDRLAAKEDEKNSRELSRIQRNTDRLIRMVNEVLDLKKIENAKIEVINRHFNLKEFLESTVDAFRLREDNSKINLQMPHQPVWINSSRELIETILYNLLSNAIKFNQENSSRLCLGV